MSRELRLASGSFSHQGTRPSQQDFLGLAELPQKGLLAVVADGIGGMDHGAELSRLAVETLLEHFSATPASGNPAAELCDLCVQGARRVREFLGRDKSGGTTLTVALVRDGRLSFLSIGDSRLALVRGRSLLWLNRPHNYAAQLLELAAQGELTLAQALRDPQGRSLTSYLGCPDRIRVDLSPEPVPLVRGDRALLMTDGVFGTLSPEEIAAAAAPAAPRAALRLAKAVAQKDREHQDNYTAVILSC